MWIEIPLDVQSAMIDPDNLEGYRLQKTGRRKDELRRLVAKFYELLEASERPVILAGNGIRSARAESRFLDLSRLLGIPVLTTWKAIDFMDEESPLFVGRPGLAGQRGANFSQQTSDLFISIGARLDHGQTAFNHTNFARNAKKVMVDIDQAEIDKMGFPC